jgi:hypothetical protein
VTLAWFARGVVRALLWTALILGLLFALGIIYLILFPPFRIPETGQLESNLQRDVTLRVNETVAVLELEVRQPYAIFRTFSSGEFPPTRLSIESSTATGSPAPYRLRLYPADERQAADLVLAHDGRSMTWPIDCQEERRNDCNRRYLLVVSRVDPVGEATVRVDIRASLRYPPHVEAPMLTWIHLGAGEMRPDDEVAAFRSTATEGSAVVSPDVPAVSQSVAMPLVDGASFAGLSFEVSTRRVGDFAPVGLRAPPPVRVVIARGDGLVVADLGARAGATIVAGLPAIHGDHRVVVLWNDRAEQGYEVTWRLEVTTLASTPPGAIRAGPAEPAQSVGRRTSSGVATMTVNGGSELDLETRIALPGVPTGHLAGLAGVLRLELELLADEHATPVTLLLAPDHASVREDLSVVLPAGEPVALTLEALGTCQYGCASWTGEVPLQGDTGRSAGREVTIRWEATFELWDVDLRESPLTEYFYEEPK